jgi:hypothetical protein
MATEVRTREELHSFIDRLSEAEWEDFVDLINTYLDDGDLTDEELKLIDEGRQEYRRGETVPFERLKPPESA